MLKKNCLFCVLCAGLLSGCMTAEYVYEEPLPEPVLSRRFISLRQVSSGLTRDEVRALLGTEVVVGQELVDPEGERYKPVTVANPFKSETLRRGNDAYTVDYYLVGIYQDDGKVTDEELVPLVFRDGRLIGQGWAFLQRRVKVRTE
ncbi:MAG: hypothetical protein ACLFPX_08495 [Candidatus Omnitrophota bacterium]